MTAEVVAGRRVLRKGRSDRHESEIAVAVASASPERPGWECTMAGPKMGSVPNSNLPRRFAMWTVWVPNRLAMEGPRSLQPAAPWPIAAAGGQSSYGLGPPLSSAIAATRLPGPRGTASPHNECAPMRAIRMHEPYFFFPLGVGLQQNAGRSPEYDLLQRSYKQTPHAA